MTKTIWACGTNFGHDKTNPGEQIQIMLNDCSWGTAWTSDRTGPDAKNAIKTIKNDMKVGDIIFLKKYHENEKKADLLYWGEIESINKKGPDFKKCVKIKGNYTKIKNISVKGNFDGTIKKLSLGELLEDIIAIAALIDLIKLLGIVNNVSIKSSISIGD